jgi:hypothetical protein
MLEDDLRAQAAALGEEFADHDDDAFTQRLADRILAPAPTAGGARIVAPAHTGGYYPNDKRPSDTRPPARPRRRRPTPILTDDPATTPKAMFAELKRLCDMVLRSRDVDRLADFVADFDEVGARTFGCLLYAGESRRELGLYWWRFAAGAEDTLAAHLLAVHYAAAGNTPHARLWRAMATMMGYHPDIHLPRTVRTPANLLEDFVRETNNTGQVQTFLGMTQLPKELAA